MVRLIDEVRKSGLKPLHDQWSELSALVTETLREDTKTFVVDNILRLWVDQYTTTEKNKLLLMQGQSVKPPFTECFIEARSTPAFNEASKLTAIGSDYIPEQWGILVMQHDHWEELEGRDDLKGEQTRFMVEKLLAKTGFNKGAMRFSYLNPGDNKPITPIRWALSCYMIVQGFPKGSKSPIGPVLELTVYLQPDGSLAHSATNSPLIVSHNNTKSKIMMPLSSFRMGVNWVYPFLFSLSLMNCEQVKIIQIIPQDRIAAAYQNRSGYGLSRYHLVLVNPSLATQGEIERGIPPSAGNDVLFVPKGHFLQETPQGTFHWEEDHA